MISKINIVAAVAHQALKKNLKRTHNRLDKKAPPHEHPHIH